MSQFMSLLPMLGTLGGSAFGPGGAALGGMLGGLGGQIGSMFGAEDARRENERRYRSILDLLRNQGIASKADIAIGGKEERGQITQSAVGRGLFNTSVMDGLLGASRSREARDSAHVDAGVAGSMAGVMERRTDAYPADVSQQMGALGQGAGQILGGGAWSGWGGAGSGGQGQPSTPENNPIGAWYRRGGLLGMLGGGGQGQRTINEYGTYVH